MQEDEKKSWVRGLFVQYEGRLLRYVMKFTNREMASEIVQESFVKLLKLEEPSKIFGNELPWLFRVSRNRALDRLKKEKPMGYLKDGEEIPFESDSAEEKIQKDQQKTQASKILESLTSTQKEVVRLKFQEDMTYRQIAEVTGHSTSHVGVILHEALKKLRNQAQKVKQHEGS